MERFWADKVESAGAAGASRTEQKEQQWAAAADQQQVRGPLLQLPRTKRMCGWGMGALWWKAALCVGAHLTITPPPAAPGMPPLQEAWQRDRLELEGRWRAQIDGLKGRWAAEQAGADAAWARKLEAAAAVWREVGADQQPHPILMP